MLPLNQTVPAYLGIDPGKQGGMVVILSQGVVAGTPMLETERDNWDWLYMVTKLCPVVEAVIEKVHAMPGQGVTSMFTFGQGYGGMRMALTALGASWEDVTPQAWMKGLQIPSIKGEEKPARKERLRGIAQRLHPHLEIWDQPKSKGKQLAIADALLIATYCRRKHTGTL